MKKIDLTGQTFGRLTVLRETNKKDNGGKDSVYLCECIDGNKIEVASRHLRGGGTTSCGCFAQETRSNNGKLHKHKDRESVLYKGLFAKFKNDLRHRGRTFSISLEEFKTLSKDNCFYCGAVPNNEFTYIYSGETLLYNGIDRIDNKKEYNIENLVSCCWRCNSSKNNASMLEFVKWINNINNNFCKSETFIELTQEMKKNI